MTDWDIFFNAKIEKIFNEQKLIIDIGGGLRVSPKGNRHDASRDWIEPLMKKADYKILDPVPDYQPDIIGDIHHLPLADDSVDAIICLAVLEHVENPILAVSEMKRVLKPGGYLLVYVPFLYYYHAEKGYYADYWRFSEDAVKSLFKDFSSLQSQNVRGALGTWLKLSPLGRWPWLLNLAGWLDQLTGKAKSRQTSGYYVFLTK